jgi:hypothetical protein
VAAVAADTIVGVVSEVGADPSTWMSVQPTGGGRPLRLSGDSAAVLRGVTGAEVWLSGATVSDGFRVDAFEIRKANGQVVDDGVVSVEQDKVSIRMRSGTQREVPYAPPALKALVGARIWVTRPVTNQAPTYGLIRRP